MPQRSSRADWPDSGHLWHASCSVSIVIRCVNSEERRRLPQKPFPAIRLAVALACGALYPATAATESPGRQGAEEFLIVDCLLPGQLRRLGSRTTYLSARQPARLSSRDCQIRGGEYVEYDRANLRSALAAWLPRAEQGDREARTVVGEIYERGLGVPPDFVAAARWYSLAAEAGDARAQVNLGHLYERGLGVAADARRALQLYRTAVGLTNAIDLDNDARAVAAVRAANDRIAELESALATSRQQLTVLEKARAADEARQVAAHGTELSAQRAEIARLEQAVAAAQSSANEQRLKLEQIAGQARERLLAGPKLSLVEPVLVATRDIVKIAAAETGARQIVGRVSAPAGLLTLTVNGSPVQTNDLGVFKSNVVVSSGAVTPVEIVAIDSQGKRDEIRFSLRSEAVASSAAQVTLPKPEAVDFGRYHALVIGNNEYNTLPRLSTPVTDARELAAVLARKYGFTTTVLLNANRYQILSALNKFRETLTKRDNLLIYFAGHGELDEVNQRGHWLPIDAERDSTANWIPSTAITDILNVMQAKQVLLVADSCYSGALTRSAVGRLATGTTAEERQFWLRTMANKRSRTVLTSGGLAPVMDEGGGQHSVFAKAFLDVLRSNSETLDGQKLHREVAARVAYAAANLRFDQVPEYAPIRFAGHEAGEFFLVPRPN